MISILWKPLERSTQVTWEGQDGHEAGPLCFPLLPTEPQPPWSSSYLGTSRDGAGGRLCMAGVWLHCHSQEGKCPKENSPMTEAGRASGRPDC